MSVDDSELLLKGFCQTLDIV